MRLSVEYGSGFIHTDVPYAVDVRGMGKAPQPVPLPSAIHEAIKNPIGGRPLHQMATEILRRKPNAQVTIVVSDNTRPVPYHGEKGLIYPLLSELLSAGFQQTQIFILVGAGSHRNMDRQEIEAMIGLKVGGFSQVQVLNHEYDDDQQLVNLGITSKGSRVKVNRRYMESDLKVVTGLVESHFMAGASGGRKGICPGIVGKETLTLFHGAKFLGSEAAADLVLDGNPLHEEASEVALMAGCDFLVNVTLDDQKRVTGVFAGDLLAAHQKAVQTIRKYVSVSISRLYDIVIVPAGFVGINHYQAGKAAVEASKALKPGGQVVLVARNTDSDPIGGDGYKQCLKLLSLHGKDEYIRMISAPGWELIQEQWQVQMWCKALDILSDEKNLIYLGLEIPPGDFAGLPGLSGWKFVPHGPNGMVSEEEVMKKMLVKSIDFAVKRSAVQPPSILYLKDGPYGIPVANLKS